MRLLIVRLQFRLFCSQPLQSSRVRRRIQIRIINYFTMPPVSREDGTLLIFLFMARLASIRCHKIPANSVPIRHLLGMTILHSTQSVIPSKAANSNSNYKLFYDAACIEGRRYITHFSFDCPSCLDTVPKILANTRRTIVRLYKSLNTR